ncbi:acyl transferase/acyl hydrolase/lysophospholipase [Poronia punctata]|nr:acyl transferase/acyl hydrolase/lysophospholipase [Poronia punctata]
MRLPGGISSATESWDFLMNKKDARIPIPPTRYNIDAFHSNSGTYGAIKTTHGYFLDHIDQVTQAMFGQGVLRPNGSCLTFDAAADGSARAEAVNALYVKRLDHAIRDVGLELISRFPTVRRDIQNMDKALSKLPNPPSWPIEDELSKGKESTRIHEAEFSQPLCTALQLTLVNLLRHLGVTPVAVVGHSSGEIAAAYACGSITMDEAITVAYLRGCIIKNLDNSRCNVVACENSPASTTVSGNKSEVEKAYHSDHMKEVGELYELLLQPHICSKPSQIPHFSSVTKEVVKDAHVLEAAYWKSNLESPVRFQSALESLLTTISAPELFLLEVGPRSTLSSPIRHATYEPTLIRNQNGTTNVLTVAGKLFSKGVDINFGALSSSGEKPVTDLPPYPWHHSGRNVLRLDDVPWCRDHVIGRDMVFPGAGYIAIAGEAIRQVSSGDAEGYSIRHLDISSAMILREDSPVETILTLQNIATADMVDQVEKEEGQTEPFYMLHPATLDLAIQLFSVATSRGQPRLFDRMCVPTYFGEIYVNKAPGTLNVQANANGNSRGIIQGPSFAVSGGMTVLYMDDVKLTPLDGELSDVDTDTHAGVRLHWKPDIDSLPLQSLIRSVKALREPYPMVQKLLLLSCLEAHQRLEIGKKGVLIHSACGGVGIAAIQLCQSLGATVYATVGNQEKIKFLQDNFNIPRAHIFNSRDASFLHRLMEQTGGRGVDVVLNSLAGDLLHASWQCVAKFGKMIEIGKKDMIGGGHLRMEAFEANRSFFGVQLSKICANRRSTIHGPEGSKKMEQVRHERVY